MEKLDKTQMEQIEGGSLAGRKACWSPKTFGLPTNPISIIGAMFTVIARCQNEQ